MLVYSNFSPLPFRTGRISSSARNAPTDFNLRFGASGKPQNGAQNSAAARRQKTENSNPDCLPQSFCTARTNRRKRNFPLSRLKSNHSQAFAAPQNVCLRPEEFRKDELVFSKSRMPAHETFPRRTQNSRRTAGQRAFPTECAHAKFHSKKRANNAQERRRGGVYCRIRQTPCPAPPERPKKTPAFAVSESGRDGRESGLCAPAKSLNTSICTR